jgi:hypothetical protein
MSNIEAASAQGAAQWRPIPWRRDTPLSFMNHQGLAARFGRPEQ